MDKRQHTPGPWTLEVGVTVLDKVWDAEGQFPVASFITGRRHDADEGTANAKLIAAAPDLLAALIELEKVESSPHSETVRYLAREQARAAIAKATNGA